MYTVNSLNEQMCWTLSSEKKIYLEKKFCFSKCIFANNTQNSQNHFRVQKLQDKYKVKNTKLTVKNQIEAWVHLFSCKLIL